MGSANKPGFAIVNADVGNEESVQSVKNLVIYKPITLDVLEEKVPIATCRRIYVGCNGLFRYRVDVGKHPLASFSHQPIHTTPS